MVLKVIKNRRSVRSFQKKAVEREKLEEILKAAQFAPSANHICPWQFWVIEKFSVLKQLAEMTVWGSFIAQAPLAIAVVLDENASAEWIEDGAIVGAHIYLETTNQGLGTCWVHVRGKESEAGIKKLLAIPESQRVLAIFPIGYPAEEKQIHSDDEYDVNKVHYNND